MFFPEILCRDLPVNSTERKRNVTKRKIIYSFAAFATVMLIGLSLVYAGECADAAREGLALSARAIVPALFAFFVFSRLLSNLPLPRHIYKILPIHRLLGLPDVAAPVVLCGLIGGFPVGAALTCGLYKDGSITRGEASRLCAVASNVSPAFLIGVVGGRFSSIGFGVMLWIVQSAAAVGIGVIMRPFTNDGHRLAATSAKGCKTSLIGIFCDAVTSSAQACLAVTGYIVFFRVIAAILCQMIPELYGAFVLIFEFSGGVDYAAAVGSRVACGFAVGFGGLSALMQITNYTEKTGVPVVPTVIMKLCTAVILAFAAWAFGIVA